MTLTAILSLHFEDVL